MSLGTKVAARVGWMNEWMTLAVVWDTNEIVRTTTATVKITTKPNFDLMSSFCSAKLPSVSSNFPAAANQVNQSKQYCSNMYIITVSESRRTFQMLKFFSRKSFPLKTNKSKLNWSTALRTEPSSILLRSKLFSNRYLILIPFNAVYLWPFRFLPTVETLRIFFAFFGAMMIII